MVLLAARSRRCLGSCCMGTLCLQLLLWVLCAVNGEEQPFSVEVRTVICWQDSIKEQDSDFPSRSPALCVVLPHMSTVFEAHCCLLMFQQQQGLCEMPSWVVVPFSPRLYNIPGQKVLMIYTEFSSLPCLCFQSGATFEMMMKHRHQTKK